MHDSDITNDIRIASLLHLSGILRRGSQNHLPLPEHNIAALTQPCEHRIELRIRGTSWLREPHRFRRFNHRSMQQPIQTTCSRSSAPRRSVMDIATACVHRCGIEGIQRAAIR
jgi:hypothetical protein